MADVTPIGVQAQPSPAADKTQRPNKVIPTERLVLSKQLAILRAFVAASGQAGETVTNRIVAEIVGMAESTVSLANNFFLKTRLLSKGVGGFLPSNEVVSYVRAHEWNPDTAAHKLAPALSQAWFVKVLKPKLGFKAMVEADAINLLADNSAAAPKYKPNLKLLIDYMVVSGIAQRDGTQLKLAKPQSAASVEPTPHGQDTEHKESTAAQRASVATAFTQATEGGRSVPRERQG